LGNKPIFAYTLFSGLAENSNETALLRIENTMKQIKVAVIGAGFMADEHIKAFSDIPEVAMLGIYSRTRARAEALAQKHSIPQVYDSIDALYAGTQADLVIIAVPELSVNEVCKAAFKHPWQALIEKPVGYNLADAEDIATAAGKVGRKAYVALNRRHYSSTRAVLQELECVEGQRLVQVFDQENPIAALEVGQQPLVVENWMYANSIHIIDYLCVFCRGKVTEVEHVIKWDPKEPRFVLTKVNYSSGDIGVYQAIWNGPGPWAVTVTTQAKRWEMRPLEQAASQVYKSRKSEPIPVHSWDTQFKAGLRLQAEETIKALRGEANKLPTLTDGIATMKLVNLIYEA
jgi:predicted dehydrogenase